MSHTRRLRIGTRASALARWQADWVAARLRDRGASVELVPVSTRGDAQQGAPVSALGGEGLFTKELQRALLDGRIDLAVHSLKDLPTQPADGLCLAAVPERGPVCDVLIARAAASLDQLPLGAVVGTGSLRRRTQLLHARPDLRTADVRGNVDTRLTKLDAGRLDALVLAEAGIRRLGLAHRISEVLSPPDFFPAIGQGALAVEARADDAEALTLVAPLDDPPSRQSVSAERSMLAALAGGCLAPIAGWARIEPDGMLHLDGVVLSHDGRQRLHASDRSDAAAAAELGRRVAQALLAQGAAQLIEASRAARGAQG